MKILRLTLATLCALLITGCSTIQDTNVAETSEDVTTIDTSETSTTVETTSVSTEETQEETSIDTTSETTLESTTSPKDTSTSESEADTDTTSETSASEEDTQVDTEETIESTNGSYVIPTYCDSQYITDDMLNAVAEYFNSMVAVDVDTFKACQLSAYNQYMEEYLEESESSIEDMLNIYYNNYLLSVGDETLTYTNVSFDSITLEYPNDVDSILNTMEYITELDDITEQYEDYTISDDLTAYYQLNYAIDYTLSADGLDDFTATKSGSVLVLDLNENIYLIMLY